MRHFFLSVLTLTLLYPAIAREKPDSLPEIPLYAPLDNHIPQDEEDDSGWFLPAVSGNGNYLPVGQLSRNLIAMRFRPRGIDNAFQHFEVNGAELSDPSDGFPYWAILTSVYTLTRSHEDVQGITPGRLSPGGPAGITSVSTTDRHLPETFRQSLSLTNRSYRYRYTLQARRSFSRDWTASIGFSGANGKDGFVKGADSRPLHLAGTLQKRFGRHSLSLLLAAVDKKQGVRSAATQEVYDLAGTPYYNPNWGEQNGEIRNAKIRRYRQVLGVLSYEGQWSERLKTHAALSFFGGENSFSLPAWYDAPTPYPDYYRYLPGFFAHPETAGQLREEWQSGNPAFTQIGWDKLFEANRYNTDPNGILRSHYIIRDLVTDKRNLALAFSFESAQSRNLTLRGGIRGRMYYADNFARLNDLLGGAYWLDIDQYLLDDEYYGGMYQSDVRHPDRPVFTGDRFGYNYRMLTRSAQAWVVADFRSAAWSAFFSLEAGALAYRRDGKYEKEMFPGRLSYGPSKKIRFTEYTAKAGFFYHFTLRHRIGLQVVAAQKAPPVRGVFVSPAYRNQTLDGTSTVKFTGAELIYEWISPKFRFDLAAYATLFRGETDIRNYYDDIENEYYNLAMTGIDKIHAGTEIAADWNITPRLSLLGVLSAGVYKYDSDPAVDLFRDSDGEPMLTGSKALLSGYRLSGTPQTAGMLQLAYRTRSYWRFELSGKQTAHNYVSLNPVRRMSRALDRTGAPEIRREMAEQERLDDAFLLSFSVSKTFRFRSGGRLGFWINVDNLLDDRSIRYAGYEQLRFSKTTAGAGQTLLPFPSKYYYAYGINYYAMITLTF